MKVHLLFRVFAMVAVAASTFVGAATAVSAQTSPSGGTAPLDCSLTVKLSNDAPKVGDVVELVRDVSCQPCDLSVPSPSCRVPDKAPFMMDAMVTNEEDFDLLGQPDNRVFKVGIKDGAIKGVEYRVRAEYWTCDYSSGGQGQCGWIARGYQDFSLPFKPAASPEITIGAINVDDVACGADATVTVPLKITDPDNDLVFYQVYAESQFEDMTLGAAGPRETAGPGATLNNVDQDVTLELLPTDADAKWDVKVSARDARHADDTEKTASFSVRARCRLTPPGTPVPPPVPIPSPTPTQTPTPTPTPSPNVPKINVSNVFAAAGCDKPASVYATVTITQDDGQLGAYNIALEQNSPYYGHVIVDGPQATAGKDGQPNPLPAFSQEVAILMPNHGGDWSFIVGASSVASIGAANFDTTAKVEVPPLALPKCMVPTPTPVATIAAAATPTSTPVVATSTSTPMVHTPTPTSTPTSTPMVATLTPTSTPIVHTPTPTATPTKGGLAYTGRDSDQLALTGVAVIAAGIALAGLSIGIRRR